MTPSNLCANCGQDYQRHEKPFPSVYACKKFTPKSQDNSQEKQDTGSSLKKRSIAESCNTTPLDKKPESSTDLPKSNPALFGDLNSNEVLQELYDKGMIDFEGDEEDLIMQVPTNIIKTGKFVVDVYNEGYKKAHASQKQKFLDLTLNLFNEMKSYYFNSCSYIPPELKEQERLTQISNIFVHAVLDFEDKLKSELEKI